MYTDTQRALRLFNQARQNAFWQKCKCILLRCDPSLHDLDATKKGAIYRLSSAGIHTVSLDAICGTRGRLTDFDQHFYPLTDHQQDRWISVARARLRNMPLEVVRLYRLNNCYFVEDGHHRTSVAQAVGETVIEAEVVVLEPLLTDG